MEKQLVEKYKGILEKERAEITGELQKIAVRSAVNPSEWVSKFISSDSDTGHEAGETRADESEEFGEQLQITKSLAQRLADVELALEKIAKGTYGKCENCDKEISPERLEANPAARTCFDCDGAAAKL